MHSFAEFIKCNQSLICLDSLRNSIGKIINNETIDLSHLFYCLSINYTLKHLNFAGNFIGLDVKNFKFLCEYIYNNKTLEFLDISDNKIGQNSNNDLFYFSNALVNNKTLKNLNISLNSISNVDFMINVIKNNYTLNKIFLSFNVISDENRKYLHSFDHNNRIVF